jgi:hypothetical protein
VLNAARLTTHLIHANILILKLYSNWRRGMSCSDALRLDNRPTPRLRFVATPQDTRCARGIVDELLRALGAAQLALLLLESVHSQADDFAMAGRADEALALRRYALVISGAARELETTQQSNTTP